MKMELESNDPALALLNEYISKEVDMRVKAVVDEKILGLETRVTCHATSHRELELKVYRMEKDLEKLQNEVTELKEMDQENSKSDLQADSDHDLDSNNGSAGGSDFSDLEEKRWGETFGEKPSGDGKLKRKAVTSDEEEMPQQERKPNAAKKPGKRGRPVGSKNKVLKADLEAQNLKLLDVIKN